MASLNKILSMPLKKNIIPVFEILDISKNIKFDAIIFRVGNIASLSKIISNKDAI